MVSATSHVRIFKHQHAALMICWLHHTLFVRNNLWEITNVIDAAAASRSPNMYRSTEYTIIYTVYIYIYTHVYAIPSNFALIKYVLECASDVGCCMKPARTIGDSQKNDTLFDCACLRVLRCGHSVCLGRVVYSRLDPLHHEWVCPCGVLTLHDFTLL